MFVVVLVLTLLFLALFTLATVEAFNAQAPFGGGGSFNPHAITAVTMNGLGVFASLFLATVLAVFLTLGAVRGDAERGLLQPLVVRPLGRREFLLGRFVGAVAVCAAYIVVLYGLVVLIVHQYRDRGLAIRSRICQPQRQSLCDWPRGATGNACARVRRHTR